ncbi:hypothetical protein [Pandoravirus japonicus]|uniref:Uncharacterized protein n=1 Tax=Pandoravirus japonicus TaxID=2823154 RepID=A0A811BMF2_9VIRU|nr:hypothetical protein [Pandoravirus japonicus]
METNLGVPKAGTDDAMCTAPGDERTETAQRYDFLTAEEARAAPRPRTMPAPADWTRLPPEMREQVARALADADPRAALALYASGRQGAEAFAGQTRAVPVLNQKGELVERRLPLVDYARLSVALGAAGPLQLFLAAATRTLKAYANWRIAGPDAKAFPMVAATTSDDGRVTGDDADGQKPAGPTDYAAMLDAGVTPHQLDQMSVGALAAAARSAAHQPSLTLGRLRALLDGPMGPDPIAIARQWYHFVTAPSSDLLQTTTPLTARCDVVLGGRALSRPRNANLVDIIPLGLLLGVWATPPERADVERLRYALAIPGDVARRCLKDVPCARTDRLFDAWLRASSHAEVAVAGDKLRGAVGDQEAPVARFLALVAAAIGPLAPSTACAVAAAHHAGQVIPSFARLFASSRMWLTPLRHYGVVLHVDLRSPVVDRMLAQQQDP